MEKADRLRKRGDALWKRIVRHPFPAAICEGSLSVEKFRYYALQDYSYLLGLSRSLALTAARAPEPKYVRSNIELAHATIVVEMENYQAMLARIGATLEDAERTMPNPTNVAYVNFLSATCSLGTFWESVASLLPCFWSYEEIAEHHRDRLKSNGNDVYREWAAVYSTEGYHDLVRAMKDSLNRSTQSVVDLWPYFRLASTYEYMFWNAAQRMEKWPV